MDYIIEARFAKSYYYAPSMRSLWPIARDAVVFSCSFSTELFFPAVFVEQATRQVFPKVVNEYQGQIIAELGTTRTERGSVVVVISLTDLAVMLPSIGAVSGLVYWMAGRLFGGMIDEFGKSLTHAAARRLQEQFRQFMPSLQQPHAEVAQEVRVPHDEANRKAAEVAESLGVLITPVSGGMRVRQNGRTTGYAYMYELVPRHGAYTHIKVTIDRAAKHPPEYELLPSTDILAHGGGHASMRQLGTERENGAI